jgi:hypothetical protein
MEAHHAILFEPLRIGPVTALKRPVAIPRANDRSHLTPNGAAGLRAFGIANGFPVIGPSYLAHLGDITMGNPTEAPA